MIHHACPPTGHRGQLAQCGGILVLPGGHGEHGGPQLADELAIPAFAPKPAGPRSEDQGKQEDGGPHQDPQHHGQQLRGYHCLRCHGYLTAPDRGAC